MQYRKNLIFDLSVSYNIYCLNLYHCHHNACVDRFPWADRDSDPGHPEGDQRDEGSDPETTRTTRGRLGKGRTQT